MKYRSFISSFLVSVVVLLAGCNNPIGITPETENPENNPVVGFNVTGKVLDKDGKPVAGARARLLNTGLSAISDANGEYTIKGQAKIAKKLAKTVMIADADTPTVEGTDTLVVTVANTPGSLDSSEVTRESVQSEVIFELPPTYIIQREIVGYVTPYDQERINSIIAYLSDDSVPEQIKTIKLYYGGKPDEFSGFAYFNSSLNRRYTLFAKIYDKENKFIGQSPKRNFNGGTGGIGNIRINNPTEPFPFDNATPNIEISKYCFRNSNDSATITVNAVDSFGGSVTSCKVIVDNKEYVPVPDRNKKTSSEESIITGKVKVPVIQGDSLNITVKAEDDDGNVTIIKENVSIMESPYIESSKDNYQPSEICVFSLKPLDLKNIYLKETKIKWIIGDFVEEITSGINLWNVPSDVADTTLIKVIFTIDGQEYEVEKIMIKGESIIDEPNPNPIDSSKIVY